ncbi:hypothetical protein [Thermococcus sp.]
MNNRIMILAIVSFVMIILIFTNPKLREISEEMSPKQPQIGNIEVYKGFIQTTGDIVIRDKFLGDCSETFTYFYDNDKNTIHVYLLDFQPYTNSTNNNEQCRIGRLVEGTLIINFKVKPEYVAINIWVGKSTEREIYFESVGTWVFRNETLSYKSNPPKEQNYMLMSFNEMNKIIKQNGIFAIKS